MIFIQVKNVIHTIFGPKKIYDKGSVVERSISIFEGCMVMSGW
jgi:hypothetical protein